MSYFVPQSQDYMKKFMLAWNEFRRVNNGFRFSNVDQINSLTGGGRKGSVSTSSSSSSSSSSGGAPPMPSRSSGHAGPAPSNPRASFSSAPVGGSVRQSLSSSPRASGIGGAPPPAGAPPSHGRASVSMAAGQSKVSLGVNPLDSTINCPCYQTLILPDSLLLSNTLLLFIAIIQHSLFSSIYSFFSFPFLTRRRRPCRRCQRCRQLPPQAVAVPGRCRRCRVG
jgi:hypothetical protein